MSKFYSKEKVIGSGTFGNVWLVKSRITNNYFVLKEINLKSMNAAETQQALTEVTVLSRCRHRNIIKYKDAVIEHKKGTLSIFMEYADGGDLYTAIMKQNGVPFKEHTVITWFTEICLALQYIHHKNILHRDLKTRNIFLTKDKQIKIGDFGISRCLAETSELATTAIGTPYYLSPEICQRQAYNHKSDIWALGCILFEMAALSHPFQARSFPHLVSLILTGQRQDLPGHCSSLVRDLIQLLLNENVEQRPSADEILALPGLQPYLSELWIMQNITSSTSVPKLLNEKAGVRRHSSCSDAKNASEVPVTRRASISSADPKTAKNKFGFVSKAKNAHGKIPSTSKSHSVKQPKYSLKNSLKANFSTYKVLHPVSLKRLKVPIDTPISSQQKEDVSSKSSDDKYARSKSESDRGYQTEEAVSYISGKISDCEISGSSGKTSTKKYIDASNFKIDDVMCDEVFTNSAGKKQIDSDTISDVTHGSCECCHSQCQQCVLDMLWKNRIRGTIGPLMQNDERTELIRKLEKVFGDLFDDIYRIMISNWDTSENCQSPTSLRNITNSLNYSQLQHLPLLMQLIQLDVIPK